MPFQTKKSPDILAGGKIEIACTASGITPGGW